jgi:hypothetical protein
MLDKTVSIGFTPERYYKMELLTHGAELELRPR